MVQRPYPSPLVTGSWFSFDPHPHALFAQSTGSLLLRSSKGLIKSAPFHLQQQQKKAVRLCKNHQTWFKVQTCSKTGSDACPVTFVAFMGSCSSIDRILFTGSNCQIMILLGTRPSDWLLNLSSATVAVHMAIFSPNLAPQLTRMQKTLYQAMLVSMLQVSLHVQM